MQVHEFFQRYANTPLEKRMVALGTIRYGVNFTLSDIYQQMKELEDKMRPDIIERDKLIQIAEDYWFSKTKIVL